MCSIADFRRKSPFINECRAKMRALRLSPRTEDAYVHWIADFFAWTNWFKPPEVTGAQVTEYLSHLAIDRKVAASTQNQARRALEFMMKPNRTRKNLLSPHDVAAILKAIGEKHADILDSARCRESMKAATSKAGLPLNATHNALRVHSVKIIGRPISVQGFRRSQLLHEIAAGIKWDALEKKYGAQMVKTACADFVRQFSPKIVAEYMSDAPNPVDCLCRH